MATLTITFDAAVAQRLQAAFTETFRPQDENGDPVVPDLDMLQQYVINDLKSFVRSSEKREAFKAAALTLVDIDAT